MFPSFSLGMTSTITLYNKAPAINARSENETFEGTTQKVAIVTPISADAERNALEISFLLYTQRMKLHAVHLTLEVILLYAHVDKDIFLLSVEKLLQEG